MGLGGVSLSGDCARLPRVGGHSVRWEESCFLPPVSLPKRDVEWSPEQGNGKRIPWFVWWPRGMPIPIGGLWVQPLRRLT